MPIFKQTLIVEATAAEWADTQAFGIALTEGITDAQLSVAENANTYTLTVRAETESEL